MTFEEFLRTAGTIDFRVRATPGAHCVSCYIHPQDVNGETIDFVVVGDHVSVIKKLGMLPLDPNAAIEPSEDPPLQTFEFETATIGVIGDPETKISDLGINLGGAA